MKIRYINNGAEKHVPNQIGQGFVDAGLAVRIGGDEEVGVTAPSQFGHESFRLPKPGDAVIPRPDFAVIEYAGKENTFLAIRVNIGAQTFTFSGDPNDVPTALGGWPVPKEIAREYKKQFKSKPSLRATHAYSEGAAERMAERFARYGTPQKG